jgi:flavin-dependent dehydrogenase
MNSLAEPAAQLESEYDVVVVGARPAGAATAMLLARGGLRVLVVDQSRYGSDTLSTHALMRGGVQQLHRWGLLDQVVAAGTPAVRRTLFHYDDESVQITIKPALGVDALYAPRRTVLDPLLVDAARRAGVTVTYGVTVTDVLRDENGGVVGVTGHDRARRSLTVYAPLVIGADGRRSRVAARVGARVLRLGAPGSTTMYSYFRGLETAGYEWFWQSGMLGGLIPTNDGQVLVFALGGGGLPHGRSTNHERFLQRLQDGTPELARRVAAAERTDRFHGSGSVTPFLRQAHGSGWALVGDAGYFEDPLAAHGLTNALRDAELLARRVLLVFGGHATWSDGLAGYAQDRDRLALPLFEAAARLACFSRDPAVVRTELLRLSSAMSETCEAIAAFDVPLQPVPRGSAPADASTADVPLTLTSS